MQIGFSVGAKAARLIGRENIADVDGALVELIKNAYDADASCVWVGFSMPFPDVPDRIRLADIQKILAGGDCIEVCQFYEESPQAEGESVWKKRENLSEEEKKRLQMLLFRYNRIVVLDNGSGMSARIVKSSWMYIGTSDKEVQMISPRKHRVRTGAKGIGRFALDKLSTFTQVYTQEETAKTALCWSVDWDQFASVRLLDEVKATLEETVQPYESIVKMLAGKQFGQLAGHDWSTGTAIILSPMREPWGERMFQKVNTNLRSINPIGSVDRFDVYVNNEHMPEYNYVTEKVAIGKEDYDYRIKVKYDGQEDLQIDLLRNEVDIRKRSVTVTNEMSQESKVCKLEDFWKRENLQKKDHTREDYAREITIHKNVSTLFHRDEKERIKEVGAFTAELYFLRNTSNEHEIMKKVGARNRKKLMERFSGIKIYRDDFKVRPYGDDGPMQDWLGMGQRVQKSPASVAHPNGTWRVQPYQMLGFVRISREGNPLLSDMANREGIALTNTYYIFVDILRECLKEFEYDRQYIYREYAKWIDEQKKSIRTTEENVKVAALKMAQDNKKSPLGPPAEEQGETGEEKGDTEGDRFSKEDYLGTVYHMMQDAKKELNSKQILQVLSSSGIVLNTFFHEFNAINTQFHVRTNQLKSRIDYLLQGKEYQGLPAYNPYRYIENTLERNDRLVAALLDVIMEGLKKPNLERQVVSLKVLTGSILTQWNLLLLEKHIHVDPTGWEEEDCLYEMAVVDWYIVLNNFLLNAAWFLERSTNPDRRVMFSIRETEEGICFELENNGPPLAEKYRNNPDKIFELGETSKGTLSNGKKQEGDDPGEKEGTGLGLWVVKETVERYGGTIHVMDKENGFGLRILLKKQG